MTIRTSYAGRQLLAWVLAASLLCRPHHARAQELADPLAVALKSQGDAALVDGRFAEALDAYTRASAIEDSPLLSYNRGRALQALERNAEALDALEKFQHTASPELLGRVPKLAQLLTQVRSQVSTLRVACNVQSAAVHLGERALSLEALTRGMYVAAGSAVLVVESDGYLPTRKTLELTAGTVVSVPIHLVRRDESALLRVRSPVTAARVFVDGEFVSQAPAEVRVAPSAHVIRVEHAGYEATTLRIVLSAQENRVVDVPLSAHARITSQWWFWAGIATAAVATTAIVIATSTEKSPGSGDIAPGTVSAPLLRF